MTNLKQISKLDAVEIYKLKLEGKIERFPHGFSKNKDFGIKVIKYLIEEKLKWTDEDICSNLSMYTFIDNGVSGIVNLAFNNSPYEAINAAYPDRFKPWQIHCPKNYWNADTIKEAIKWMIEEKLKWSDEDICSNLSTNTFRENGLSTMLSMFFNNNPYEAINSIYPDRFKPWQIHCPKNYWNIDTAKNAIKWMIEEKLKWSDEEICSKLSIHTFKEYSLYSMLVTVFNCSPYVAINTTYPDRFKPWQLGCPKNYWNVENSITATKWLIEEKLKLSDEDVCYYLTTKSFREHGLGTMLYKVFSNSVYKALSTTYPGKFIKKGRFIALQK